MNIKSSFDRFLERLPHIQILNLADFISEFGSLFDLMHLWKSTPQDSVWHAEGDVYIHTQMVLDQVALLIQNEASHLNKFERKALWLSALFHDIAKPLCTQEVERYGRKCITAKHHEVLGRSYLITRLSEVLLDKELFLLVLALVGTHQIPKHLILDNALAHRYHALARQVNLELLYFLELADMRGRMSNDREDQVEMVELFKCQAQEFGAWKSEFWSEWVGQVQYLSQDRDVRTQAWIVGNSIRDYERGLIFTPEEAIARSFEKRSHFAEVVLYCGIAGSGKSTLTQKRFGDYQVISLDALRKKLLGREDNHSQEGLVLNSAIEELKVALRSGQKVVWDATGFRKDFRSKVLDLAHSYQAYTRLIAFALPMSQIKSQNQNRERVVPMNILKLQQERLEWPSCDEALEFEVIF